MLDFTYYAPTKVLFGRDREKEVGSVIKNMGFKKIMLQYGQGSIKKSGLYDTVTDSLKKSGIEYVEMGGVEPNPKVSFVREAIKIAKKEKVEMILAVGGGSVIDSSKCTAVGAVTDVDIWEFSTKKKAPEKALPVGCILTISASGSEMSSSAVLTNTELNMKRGFNSDFNRCAFSILDPCLTFTVSKYQTACGIVDMCTHTLERYFMPLPETPLTDEISEGILRSCIKSGIRVMESPCDYEARATLMWASSLCHNDLTGCGRENALPVHQLEHALSGEYDYISHGAGLSVLFIAWAKYMYKKGTKRFSRFARNVWGINEADEKQASLKGIEKTEEFFKALEMPLSLKEFNLTKDCVPRLATLCTFNGTRSVRSIIDMDYTVISEIFESAF